MARTEASGHFVEKLAARSGKSFDAIPRPLMDALSGYDWPGNVRELQNVIERAVVLSPGPVLRIDEAFGTGTLRMRSSSGSAATPMTTTGAKHPTPLSRRPSARMS